MPTVAEVRSQVAAHLLASGLLTRESAEPVEMIRSASHSPVHLEVAVGTPSDVRTARLNQSATEIVIVIPYQLEAKARIDGTTGYTAMLTLHAAILDSLCAPTWTGRYAALVDHRSTREPGADGWIWLTISCTALHSLV